MKTFIIWLGMVFVLSVVPLDSRPVNTSDTDKALHFVIYAITCLLFFTALKNRKGFMGRHAIILSVLLSTSYGFLMEVAQHFTGHRHFSMYDGLANFLGASAGALFILYSKKKHSRTKPSK